jgi:hypothetical protein
MLNIEKWKDELIAITTEGYGVGVYKNEPIKCHEINCVDCELHWRKGGYKDCDSNYIDWLSSEVTKCE